MSYFRSDLNRLVAAEKFGFPQRSRQQGDQMAAHGTSASQTVRRWNMDGSRRLEVAVTVPFAALDSQ
jgi:hypothetical protein